MKLTSLALALLVVACGSTSTVPGGSLGDRCTVSAVCASGLTCLVAPSEKDEASVCTRECAPGGECGEGFVCSDTDVAGGRKNLCVRRCEKSGREECEGVWVCNTTKRACEKP